MTPAVLGSLLALASSSLFFFQSFNHHVVSFLLITSAQQILLGAYFWRLRSGRAAPMPFRRAALLVFAFAVVLRVPVLFTRPGLSDDVYRFVWDGRVQAAGINPWVYAPGDPALVALREYDHDRINHPGVHTIYPTLSEAAFRLGAIHPFPIGQKVVFGLFDLAAIGLLLALLKRRNRPAEWAVLYAWNPVAVVEFAGSGHNDSLMIFFVLGALLLFESSRKGWSAIAWACAIMAKWIPVVALPWLIVRRRWREVALILLASAVMAVPFIQGRLEVVPFAGSEIDYGRDWIFNAGIYSIVAGVVGNPLARKVIAGGVLVVFAFWWARRQPDPARYLFGVTLALLLVGPVVHPWYLTWILPFAALLGSVTAFAWAWLATVSYVVLIGYTRDGTWALPAWAPILEYAVLYALLLTIGVRRLRRPAAAPRPLSPLTDARASVVIPALNEEKAIGRVLADLPKAGVREVIVVDNGSVDGTVAAATSAGARVEREARRGYGSAVGRGFRSASPDSNVLVVIDGDHADFPEELPRLLEPIARGEAHFVIGSRTRAALPGSLMPQQRFGNWLTCALIRLLYGHRYTDMGPFRAIRRDALEALEMGDPTFGWNVEMQVKALQAGLKVVEVPVRYRPRIGQSKISGTVKGTFKAGTVILWSIYKYAFREPVPQA